MNEAATSSQLRAIRAKNEAYSEYFKKWLMVEKAKHSKSPPTQERLEEVQRYYEAYQETILMYTNTLQENYNVSNG